MNVSLSDEIELLKNKRKILGAMIEVKGYDEAKAITGEYERFEAKKYNLSRGEDKK